MPAASAGPQLPRGRTAILYPCFLAVGGPAQGVRGTTLPLSGGHAPVEEPGHPCMGLTDGMCPPQSLGSHSGQIPEHRMGLGPNAGQYPVAVPGSSGVCAPVQAGSKLGWCKSSTGL